MELILLNDGVYSLVSVTKSMIDGVQLLSDANCFDLCDILRLKLTGYVDSINVHLMNDGSGSFVGCMCK